VGDGCRPVWSMAVAAETWAVSLLLYSVLLYLLMRWTGRPERRQFLYAAAFVYGLLLTGNQELFVMIPALLVVALFNDRELERNLSLLTSLLIVVAWAMGAVGVWRWLVSEMLQGPGLLIALLLVGVAGLTVTVNTRRVGSA